MLVENAIKIFFPLSFYLLFGVEFMVWGFGSTRKNIMVDFFFSWEWRNEVNKAYEFVILYVYSWFELKYSTLQSKYDESDKCNLKCILYKLNRPFQKRLWRDQSWYEY